MSAEKMILNGAMSIVAVIAVLLACGSLFAFHLVIAAFRRRKEPLFVTVGSIISFLGFGTSSWFLWWFLLFYRF